MRNTQTVKDQVTELKRRDGVMTASDQEVADVFSEYFKEVYTVENLSNMPKVLEKDYNWDDAICFSKEVVLDKLQKLRTDKSPGPEALHPMLLKKFVEPLSQLFYETGSLRPPSFTHVCTVQNHGIHHQGITCQIPGGKQAWVPKGTVVFH